MRSLSSRFEFLSRLSLAPKLAAAFVLFSVVTALMIFGVFKSMRPIFEQSYRGEVEYLAHQSSNVIDRNLFERYGDVQAITENRAAHDSENWNNQSEENPLVQAMNAYMKNYGLYKMMILVSPKGKVLAVNTKGVDGKDIENISDVVGKDVSEELWFQNALAGKFLEGKNGFTGTAVWGPEKSEFLGNVFGDEGFTLAFSAPMKDASGKILGVWVNFAAMNFVEDLVAHLHEEMHEHFSPRAADGNSAVEYTLLDDKGRIIVDYDPKGQGWKKYKPNFNNTILKYNLVEKGNEAAKAIQKGVERGNVTLVNERKGGTQVVGFSGSEGAYDFPGLKWGVLASESTRIIEKRALASAAKLRPLGISAAW